ncbi:hypothetical protein IQ250_11245 [Pseudanabaenaceae cyanobacterium LEGE 13415]|nr:hypothetical protein [Pseudanabaenaceae cyanobacterium LEGE 13415]
MSNQTIREIWANQHAAAYKAQDSEVQSLQANPSIALDLTDEKTRSTIPQPVLEAYNYYYDQVASADWGSVSVSQEKIQNQDVYAVTVSTDGDDGWAELFDATGQELGAARTLCDQVAWGDPTEVRSYTQNSALPLELQAKQDDQNA